MERYLKDHEPQIKPEPIDMIDALDTADWIKAEMADDDYDDAFGDDGAGGVLLKHEFLIKSEPSDLDDTDDDRLSLDDLNIWDQRLSGFGGGIAAGGKTAEQSSSGSSTGFLSSSSSTSSIHSLDGDAPPPYSSPPSSLHGGGGGGGGAAPASTATSTPPTTTPSSTAIKLAKVTAASSQAAAGGRVAASASAAPSPLDRREQLTVRVAAAPATAIPIQTLTPPSSPESGIGGGHPSSMRSLPTGLVRVTGPNGTRSAIIRVTARGGKMIPRLISFAPASAFKSLSETHLRLEQALGTSILHLLFKK
jgi:hypothetical protein